MVWMTYTQCDELQISSGAFYGLSFLQAKVYLKGTRTHKSRRGCSGRRSKPCKAITLNRPHQLNVISSKVVVFLAEFLEKWEKDDDAELVIIKGAGRAFSAGGDLKMFYDGRSDDSYLEVVYRMYWLCYHIHTYRKTQVALVHGLVMGGGASLTAPLKFSAVTEKTVFAVPEASIGFHTDCSFSYILSQLPGHLGKHRVKWHESVVCCDVTVTWGQASQPEAYDFHRLKKRKKEKKREMFFSCYSAHN